MVKSIAEKHGLRATFMPKPFPNLTGNGLPRPRLAVGRRRPICSRTEPASSASRSSATISSAASCIPPTRCARSLNPTVNSYKRINAPRTLSGATWSPNTVTYTGNNRTHMIRIPDAGRFELRLADGAANPYLLQAGILAAGLDGIENQRDPGKRLDINMYTDGHTVKDAKRLPLNLLDALRAFEASPVLKDYFGGFVGPIRR